jgi:hypothetical protein
MEKQEKEEQKIKIDGTEVKVKTPPLAKYGLSTIVKHATSHFQVSWTLKNIGRSIILRRYSLHKQKAKFKAQSVHSRRRMMIISPTFNPSSAMSSLLIVRILSSSSSLLISMPSFTRGFSLTTMHTDSG